ncbi:MAG: ABC transporter permease [Leptospirales bacterium]|jgi:peptide/nickel transport system permease protein
MLSLIVFNLIVALAGAAAILAVTRFFRRYAEARRRLFRSRSFRYSFYVLAVYLCIGYVDLFRFPYGANLSNVSPIDVAFSQVGQERTYSAPFARTVVLAADEAADAPENQVRGVHPLGTDVNGYDVLYNVMKGCSTALLLVLGTMLVSFPVGLFLGILAGYFGGFVDDFVQWLYTTIASIPWLLFVLAFLLVFGRSLFWICLAFGLTSWVELARLVRGETLRLREMNYIRAARASGVSTVRILWRHLTPNLSHVVIITFTLTASAIVLAESVLTFIGIGVQPGGASWGRMLVEAQVELVRTPPIWWVFAGASFVGIFPFVLALNLAGDALRDALDPRGE